MSWETAFAGEREQAARGPVPAAPATLGEIWRSGWNAAGLDTVFGQGDPWAQAQSELRSAVEGAAGMSAAELAKAQGRPLRALDWAGSTWQDQARELGELASGLTPEQQELVKPLLDVPGRARKIAADREREAADIADRTYGLAGHAVGFLAGVTRAAIDPINAGTMFVGGPLAGSVPKMLMREGLLGVGIQAVQEPFVQAGRAELGLEAGIGRSLANVAEAGIGNAGLAGLFRGAGWLMRRAAAPADAPAVRAADAVSEALQESRLVAGEPARPETVAEPPAKLADQVQAAATERGNASVSPQDILDDPRPAGDIRADLTRRGLIPAIPQRRDPRMDEVERLLGEAHNISAGIEGSRGVYPKSEQQIRDLTAQADRLEREVLISALGTGGHSPRNIVTQPAEPAIPAALRDLGPADLDAAARLAERDDLVDALAPDPSGPGKLLHGETVEAVIARMESSSADIMSGLDTKIAELELRLRQVSGDAQAQTAGGESVTPPAPPARRQRPQAEPKPVSLGRFIAMNGGIKIDEGGDVRYLGINQMFVPGVGMVGRRNGLQLDRDLEPLLIAEGYLRPHDPGMPSRDVTKEVHDALIEEFVHKNPLYSMRDQARAADIETSRAKDIDQRWRDEIETEAEGIRQQIRDGGGRVEDYRPEDIADAADLIVRGVEPDWEMAFERVAIMRELGDDAAPSALAAAEDLPDWEIADAIFGRSAQDDSGRAGSGGGQGDRPGAEGGSGAARQGIPQSRGDGAAPGGREGDPPLEAQLARLAAASDDPALFKARLADLARNLEAAGGDIQLELDGGTVSARKLLEEIRDDATAADALKACLGQGGPTGGTP